MLKVVTWNINSIGVRQERLLAFLAREQPDVLCLQELKCLDENFPGDAVKAAGYHVVTHGQKSYNGVALISKSVPEGVVRGFGDDSDDAAARFIAARYGTVTVISAYIPNGQEVGSDKYFYKLEWLQRLQGFLNRHHKPDEDLLLTGDFNVAPADLDVHSPVVWRGRIMCSEAERAALRSITDFGLVDTFRDKHPDEKAFSWWDYRMLSFPKNLGLRIDLILATKSMAARCQNVRIDRNERKGDKPSDHAPVIGEFSS